MEETRYLFKIDGLESESDDGPFGIEKGSFEVPRAGLGDIRGVHAGGRDVQKEALYSEFFVYDEYTDGIAISKKDVESLFNHLKKLSDENAKVKEMKLMKIKKPQGESTYTVVDSIEYSDGEATVQRVPGPGPVFIITGPTAILTESGDIRHELDFNNMTKNKK